MTEANRRIRLSNEVTAAVMAQHRVPVLDADEFLRGWLGASSTCTGLDCACGLYEDWVHIGPQLHVRMVVHEVTEFGVGSTGQQ